jgi:hypothetical protein
VPASPVSLHHDKQEGYLITEMLFVKRNRLRVAAVVLLISVPNQSGQIFLYF